MVPRGVTFTQKHASLHKKLLGQQLLLKELARKESITMQDDKNEDEDERIERYERINYHTNSFQSSQEEAGYP